MQELLDHIAARFPEVAMGCREFAARWLADEAALLEPNHVLVRSRDDILPGLARAIRARDVELSELARRCGLEARDLRVTVALSRLGELLNPGDIANLSDQELDSKLRQAAREFGLHADELLQEIGNPSSAILRNSPLGTSIGNPAIGRRRRCWHAADCGRSVTRSTSTGMLGKNRGASTLDRCTHAPDACLDISSPPKCNRSRGLNRPTYRTPRVPGFDPPHSLPS